MKTRTYFIYQITIGSAKYIGSTNNYKVRMLQHLKSLKQNNHPNDKLLSEFKKGKRFNSKILAKFDTMFKKQVLLKEQRYINRYSNCNEATASKYVGYSVGEFFMDTSDFIKNNWKLLAVLIFAVLVIGYGMGTEEAYKLVQTLISMYMSLGG